MAMSALYGLLAICLVGIAETISGTCPDIQTMPDFKLNRFRGKWYERMRYFKESERYVKCVWDFYTPHNVSTVKFVQSKIDAAKQKGFVLYGILSQPNPAEPGQLVRTIRETSSKDNFWILGTDYDDFAVTYSCKTENSSYVQSAWVLTRRQSPSDQAVERALKLAVDHNIDATLFIDTVQVHCIV